MTTKVIRMVSFKYLTKIKPTFIPSIDKKKKIDIWEHNEYRLWHKPRLLPQIYNDPNQIPIEYFIS